MVCNKTLYTLKSIIKWALIHLYLSSETIRGAYIWLYFTVIFKAPRFKSSITSLLYYLCLVQKLYYFSTLLVVFKCSSLVSLRKWKKIEARFTGFTFKAADIKTINLIKRILSGLHNIAIQSFLTLHTTSSE